MRFDSTQCMILDRLDGKKQQKIPAEHLKTVEKIKQLDLLNTQNCRKKWHLYARITC